MEKNKSALVIIDMQLGFTNEHTKHVPVKIAEFLKDTDNKKKFDYIIATKYINNDKTACYKYENWHSCMGGTDDVKFCTEIEGAYNISFIKDKFTCYNEEFKNFLRQKNITKLYFCGVNTGCCVLHSVLDCYEDVLDCYVLEDLCGSTSGNKMHEIALELLKSLITKQRIIKSTDIGVDLNE